MQLCQYHRDDIRLNLSRQGVKNESLAFRCEALVLSLALDQEPSLLGELGCPVCKMAVPSWIKRAVNTVLENQSS